jgi:hypothetical protein
VSPVNYKGIGGGLCYSSAVHLQRHMQGSSQGSERAVEVGAMMSQSACDLSAELWELSRSAVFGRSKEMDNSTDT